MRQRLSTFLPWATRLGILLGAVRVIVEIAGAVDLVASRWIMVGPIGGLIWDFTLLASVVLIMVLIMVGLVSVVFQVVLQLVSRFRKPVTTAVVEEPQQLIRATPGHIRHGQPTVVEAFLDVETTNQNQPLRNCRVMLVGLHTYSASTHWQEDPAYSGQTYFFTWRDKEPTVEARDIQGKEQANIAKATRTTQCEWTTTDKAIGRIGHGDQYRLKVEITADNSLPLQRDYWVRIGIGGVRPVIEDWDDAKHEHPLLLI